MKLTFHTLVKSFIVENHKINFINYDIFIIEM